MKYKINNHEVIETPLRGTYNKARLIESKNLIILCSYDSFIALYWKPLNLMIVNINKYEYNRTTNTHYKIFETLTPNYDKFKKLPNFKGVIYLKESEFMGIINDFMNFGNPEVKIGNLYKNYSLEISHLESLFNKGFDDFNKENLKYCFNGFMTIDKQTETLKTRTKNIYYMELPSEYYKPVIKITETLNNKGKILKYDCEVVSKFSLSFNNFKPSELRGV